MKYLGLSFAVLAVMVTLMIWANRPELLAKPQEHLQAANDKLQHWNEKRNRKAAFEAWMAKLQLPQDCATTQSHLRKLECKNQRNLHAARFSYR
ncbi:MAG: hypothetical protein AB1722_00760 [Pseudomonadota bacterium]